MPYKVDFKQLATDIDILDVARHLKLVISKDKRAHCPTCDSDRAIQIFVETNSFRCHVAEMSGDCIGLYAHVVGTAMYKSALVLQELFATPSGWRTTPETAPQKPEARTAPAAQPAPASVEFDPDVYAKKLQFNENVAALGISEEDAARLQIGFASTGIHRGRVAIPLRDASGQILGFMGWDGSTLKFPKRLPPSKVVPFVKRA